MPVLQAGTQQDGRRIHCSRCYYHNLRMDGQVVCFPCLFIGHGRFDTLDVPVIYEHFVSTAMHDDACAMVVGILQVGLHSGLLTPVAAAETTGSAALLALHGVTWYHFRMVAKGSTAIVQQLVLPVMFAILGIDVDPFLHGSKALLQLRAGEAAMQARTLLPFLKHAGGCAERSHPVNRRAAPKSAACQDDDTQVF